MKLPNAELAVVDIRKLRDYCLDSSHPRGRHKARVFESALGLTKFEVQVLLEALLEAARNQDAQIAEADQHGRRYIIEFEMQHGARRAVIHSGWIVRTGEDLPRITTCYVR